MLRWFLRYGAVRVVGRRALPALMLWDAAVLANKARQIPAVDRTIRRSAAAAADRFADALDGLTPPIGRSGGPARAGDERGRDDPDPARTSSGGRRRRQPGR